MRVGRSACLGIVAALLAGAQGACGRDAGPPVSALRADTPAPVSPLGIRFECKDLVTGGATHGSGRGTAFVDYDGDGDLDVVQGNMMASAMLLDNLGDGSFEEEALAGFEPDYRGRHVYGIAVGDYDLDGDPDIYVGRGGMMMATDEPGSPGAMSNRLLENRGGRFVDVTERAGVGEMGTAFAVRFFDYDGDGDPDIYVTNSGEPNVLYENNGDGTFTDVTSRAGVDLPPYALDSAWFDYDVDGLPDLFVTGVGFITSFNMAVNSVLYRNNGDGTFSDVTKEAGIDPRHGGLSVLVADFTNDGLMDIYVPYWRTRGDMNRSLADPGLPIGPVNRLYINSGEGFFTEARDSGLEHLGNSISATTGDFDNDGFLDVYLGTGGPQFQEPDRLYRNNGDGTFLDITREAGIREKARAHGMITGDYDGDGKLDIYVSAGGRTHADRTSNVMCHNVGDVGNWLQVRVPREGHSIMGVTVTLIAGGAVQTRQIGSGSGFGSVNSPIVHFGLGASSDVDSVTVRWTDGHTREVTGPAVNRLMVVRR